ncbi:hypothetical protein PVK06_017438 [Gossypium arboreum]|uniref:S-protein homolog n=1 Tax=Gossypium arboreum TaxID=29729 RepID=A0ABR0Q2N6_GOSAR|nr:hypothetical protein PVK06_017438 [Gossypium arboreum]
MTASPINWLLSLTLLFVASEAILPRHKVDVLIYNYLQNGTDLTVHCKSKDDDLGVHLLAFRNYYESKFRPNLFGTTLFYCSMQWDGIMHIGSTFIHQREILVLIAYGMLSPRSIWKTRKKFEIQVVGQILFLISFENEDDLETILEGQPWIFPMQLVIFDRLENPIERSKIRLVLSLYWIKIRSCPLKNDKKDLMHAIGSTFGRVIKLEVKGDFCWLSIQLDVQKPLRREIFVLTGNWNDENVQVYTIAASNKVTSKCRVIVPTWTVKRIIYECYLKHFSGEKYLV